MITQRTVRNRQGAHQNAKRSQVVKFDQFLRACVCTASVQCECVCEGEGGGGGEGFGLDCGHSLSVLYQLIPLTSEGPTGRTEAAQRKLKRSICEISGTGLLGQDVPVRVRGCREKWQALLSLYVRW